MGKMSRANAPPATWYDNVDPIAGGGSLLAVFRVLRCLTEKMPPYPLWLTYAGIVVQQLQLLFFVYSPRFLYELVCFKQLALGVALFSAPLSENIFGSVSYEVYTGVSCTFAVLTAATLVVFLSAAVFPPIREHRLLMRCLRAGMECVAGWLFLPLLHLFLGGMMCRERDAAGGGKVAVVYNFAGAGALCNGPLHTVNVVMGSFSVFAAVAVGLLMCCVFDDDPQSIHPLSRPHGYVDIISVIVKTVIAILYHILMCLTEHVGAYSLVVMGLFLLMLLVLSFTVPYYHLTTASLHGLTLAMCAFFALINTFSGFQFMAINDMAPGVQSTVALSMVPFAAVLGWSLARCRVNTSLDSYGRHLSNFGVVPEHVAKIPLPRSHRRSRWHAQSSVLKALQGELRQEIVIGECIASRDGDGACDDRGANAGHASGVGPQRNLDPPKTTGCGAGTGDVAGAHSQCPLMQGMSAPPSKHQFELFMPFVDRVHLPTDVELSTRFLRSFEESTGSAVQLSAMQLGYVLRVYAEALSYFRQSPHVTVSLAAFLLYYCDRAEAAMEVLDEMLRQRGGSVEGVDLMTRLKLCRLWDAARDSLGYRDTTNRFALRKARVLHRQTLATTMRFWNLLLEYQDGDQIELIHVSDQLAEQRRATIEAYRHVLSVSPDDTLVLSYIASFVEDVLGSKEVAQEVRYAIEDIEERRKNRKLCKRGRRAAALAAGATASTISGGGGGSSLGRANSLSTVQSDGTIVLKFDDILAATHIDDTAAHTGRRWERTFFIFLTYLCVLMCFASSLVCMILALHHAKTTIRFTSAIQDANAARGFGYRGVHYATKAGMYFYEHDCAEETNACTTAAEYFDMLQGVSDAEMFMRVNNAHVTWGELAPSFDSVTYRFLTEGLLDIHFTPFDSDDYFFSGTMSAASGQQVSLYALLRMQLSRVGVPQSMWTAMMVVSGYFTELFNRMRKGSVTYLHYLQFLTDDGADDFLDAYGSLARAMAADVKETRENTMSGLIAALVVMAISIILGVASFYVNVHLIAKSRVLLVGVFSLVPQLFLEQLRGEMRDRLEKADVTADHNAGEHGNSDTDGEGGVAGEGAADGDSEEGETLRAADEGRAPDGQQPWDATTEATSTSGTNGGGPPSISRNSPGQRALQVAANRRFVRRLLQQAPHRSCLKSRVPRGLCSPQRTDMTEGADSRTVRFALTSEDLVDKPKPRLVEPAALVDGSSEEIIAEFEKSLLEMDVEARKESERSQRGGHDTSTSDRMVMSAYRLTWWNIRDTLASWSRTISAFDCMYVGIFIPFLALTCAAVLGLSVATLKLTEDSLSVATTGLGEMLALYTHAAEFDRLDAKVATFINFLDPGYARRVADYILVNGEYNDLTKNLLRQIDPSVTATTELVAALRLATVRPMLSDAIYCSLAARAGYAKGEFDLLQFPYFAIFFYADEENDPVFLSSTYPQVFESPEEYTIPPLSSMPDDPTEMHNTVLAMQRRARFFEDSEAVWKALTKATEVVCDTIVKTINTVTGSASTYLIAATCLSAVLLVADTTALVLAVRRSLGRPFYAVVVASLLCSLTVVVLSPLYMKMLRQKEGDFETMHSVLEAMRSYHQDFYQRSAQVQNFLQSPMEDVAWPIYEIFSKTPDAMQKYLEAFKRYPSLTPSLKALRGAEQIIWNIQQVALYLGYVSKAKKWGMLDSTPPSPPFLKTYNFAKEETYQSDLDRFGSDHPNLMYSTPASDLTRSTDELQDMARFAVFGLRGSHYLFAAFDAIDAAFSAVEAASRRVAVDKDKQERDIMKAVVALASVALFFMCVAAFMPLWRSVSRMGEGGSRRGLIRATVKALYARSLRSVVMAAAICALVGAAQFALVLVPLRVDVDAVGVAQNSSVRSAMIYRSLVSGVYASHAMKANSPPLAITAINDLRPSLDILTSTRQYLYFRNGAARSGYGRVPSLTDSQRAAVFKGRGADTASVDALLQLWIAKLEVLASFTPRVVPGPDTNPAKPTTKDKFIVDAAQQVSFEAGLASLMDNFDAVARGLDESDNLYREDIRKQVGATTIAAIVFFVVCCLCALFMFVVVLPWFVRLASREEQDARILLRAIPEAAADAVPAIALFMDSGVIEDQAAHRQEIERYAFSPNIPRFLAEWRQHDPESADPRSSEKICRTYLERQSSRDSGIVLCDARGNILFANTTILKWTRHDSLVDRNVGVLMPPSLAAAHDQFLARYMRAPPTEGPRTIDVIACTEDGEQLQLVAKKAEAPTRDGTMYFIAELFRQESADLHPRRGGPATGTGTKDASGMGPKSRKGKGSRNEPHPSVNTAAPSHDVSADSAHNYSINAFEDTQLLSRA